jgi:hypothetical protein
MWQRAPDVTQNAYQEEQAAVNDMERLAAENAMKSGGSPSGKQSATEAKLMAAGASRSMGFDSTIFGITFAKPVIKKLIKAIRQAAPIDMFEKAAESIKVVVDDPYTAAVTGDFRVSVGSGALQSSVDMAISNASNVAAITQSVYGPAANYYPIMQPIYEAMGLKPDDIIPNPVDGTNPLQPHPSTMDMGGVMGQDNLTVQPNVQLSGGAFKGGGESATSQANTSPI